MVEFDKENIMKNQDFPEVNLQKDQIIERLKEPMRPGQTWYLIDNKWFKTFKLFVGIDDADRCGNAINPGPIDNSLLLDTYISVDVHEEDFFGFPYPNKEKLHNFNCFVKLAENSPDLDYLLSQDSHYTIIKNGLIESLDYVALPASAWNLLSMWYGLKENQQPIDRKVINVARSPEVDPILEVYKVHLNLHDNPEFRDPVLHPFSNGDTISTVEKVCRKVFKVEDAREIKLKCFYGPNQSQILASDNTVYEENLDSNLKIVMEVIPEPVVEPPKHFIKPALPKVRDTSRIPRVVPSNNRPIASPGPGVMTRHNFSCGTLGSAEGRGPPCTKGLSGLMNLGNTCFLNSIIQCLSNCQPITQYFLDGHHEFEINSTNPLGKAGQIASSFADVISMMWSGRHSTTVPHSFKHQLTKFAPQFVGCQQHDAQELLTFLLDGVHEDLNRIKDKPYCQGEDDDLEDDALARTSWEYFLRRNDSIIIDHFHGMLKSRVVCPTCEKVSIKFDTFSTLSLPLPQRCDRPLVVRYVPYDQTLRVVDLNINVPKKGSVQDMVMELSRITMVKPEHIVIAEINKCHFHKFFSLDDPIERIDDRDKVFMYDLPADLMEDPLEKHTIVPVVLWEVQEPHRSTHFLSNLFGTPFIIVLPQGRIYFKVLYDKICDRMIRSCEGFLKGNKNHGYFSMEYETGDGAPGRSSGVAYLFSPVLVNTYTYENVHKIKDDEQSQFDVPVSFGRHLMALQIKRNIRLEMYKDPVPIYEDYSEGVRPVLKLTLENCLDLFTTTEKLGENNAWHCPRCNKKQRATKKLDLWKLPNILIFHLKRFAFNETRKEKLDTKVDFPLTGLNIDGFVVNKHKENLVYDLIGVCNHYGSLMGGHYTANCKNVNDGQWYCFDDNSVSPITPESVQTEHAYVLFYQRRPLVRADPDEEKVDL